MGEAHPLGETSSVSRGEQPTTRSFRIHIQLYYLPDFANCKRNLQESINECVSQLVLHYIYTQYAFFQNLLLTIADYMYFRALNSMHSYIEYLSVTTKSSKLLS